MTKKKRKLGAAADAEAGPSTRQRYERLCSLGKSSHVTQSGLDKLLADCKENGMPESFSRRTQYRAREDICTTDTMYGPLVTEKTLNCKGERVKVGFQNPLAFIRYHCANSPHYAQIVEETLARNPCTPQTPWDIILYQDGVNPADGLAKNQSRNMSTYYWSFKQFGAEILAHEQVWGTVCVMRHDKANKLEGKEAQLTYHVVEQFFGDEHDIRKSGVSVGWESADGTKHAAKLFAKLGVLLADEPALKEMLDCKGHGGSKPCCCCLNATHHKPPRGAGGEESTKPLHEGGGTYAVPITCCDFKSFKLYTNESLRRSVQRLGEVTGTERDKLQQLFGFNYNPWSIIIADKFGIDVADCVMYDWAHVTVCGGIVDVEFGMFMQHMVRSKTHTSYGELKQYLSMWVGPKSHGIPMHLFEDEARLKRYVKNADLPCTASEFLTLAPLLRRYMVHVVKERNQQPKYVDSMIAALDVLELLQSVKCGVVTPEKLHTAIEKHMRLFKEAYGEKAVRPKHHYALHLGDMLEKHKILLATFTQERKHRAVKRYVRGRTNKSSFDYNAMMDITLHSIWELSMPFFRAFSTTEPKGKQKTWLEDLFPNEKMHDLTLHADLTINGGACKNGDIVSFMYDGHLSVGELLLTVGVAPSGGKLGQMVCFVSLFEYIPDEANADHTLYKYRVLNRTVRVHEHELDTVFCHKFSKDGTVCFVVVPYECRP